MSDEDDIRQFLTAWATAVHTGDLATVVADHADDIVMFDVPPPFQGVRGIDAYRDAWPPFFRWQESGAVFDIESLDVVAGRDVAFAYALLLTARRSHTSAMGASVSRRQRSCSIYGSAAYNMRTTSITNTAVTSR